MTKMGYTGPGRDPVFRRKCTVRRQEWAKYRARNRPILGVYGLGPDIGPVPVYALYIGKYRPVYTVYIGCIAVFAYVQCIYRYRACIPLK